MADFLNKTPNILCQLKHTYDTNTSSTSISQSVSGQNISCPVFSDSTFVFKYSFQQYWQNMWPHCSPVNICKKLKPCYLLQEEITRVYAGTAMRRLLHFYKLISWKQTYDANKHCTKNNVFHRGYLQINVTKSSFRSHLLKKFLM